jgi:2-polyprenyl-6-methoxyphenol hydroxylase-like FAD-dependent oxidoreductase
MTVEITTDVLIIGTGPAGSTCAALLATYGIECLAINRYRWLAHTPVRTSPTSGPWRCCVTWARRSRTRR